MRTGRNGSIVISALRARANFGGRKQLGEEMSQYESMIDAIGRVLQDA